MILIYIGYTGPRERGQEYLDMIRAWDGEGCLLNDVSTKKFVGQQESVERMLKGICMYPPLPLFEVIDHSCQFRGSKVVYKI